MQKKKNKQTSLIDSISEIEKTQGSEQRRFVPTESLKKLSIRLRNEAILEKQIIT